MGRDIIWPSPLSYVIGYNYTFLFRNSNFQYSIIDLCFSNVGFRLRIIVANFRCKYQTLITWYCGKFFFFFLLSKRKSFQNRYLFDTFRCSATKIVYEISIERHGVFIIIFNAGVELIKKSHRTTSKRN